MAWPRTRTYRLPNSSLSRPLTRSTVVERHWPKSCRLFFRDGILRRLEEATS